MTTLGGEQSRGFFNGPLQRISNADRAIVKASLARWADHKRQAFERGGRILSETAGDPRRRDERLWDHELACRLFALEMRDRLLRELSPEGSAALNVLKEGTLAHSTYNVPKAEQARFYLPQ